MELAFLRKAVAPHRGRRVHVVLDNLSTPDVLAWLDANPHVHLHFTPTGSSWINQIEIWFGIITTWNANPRPFTWTATADEILAKAQLVQTNIKKLVANNTK